MIATVTPASNQYEETLNTLNYANRAKKIHVVLQKNILQKSDIGMLGNFSLKNSKHENIINSMKNEIMELRKLLSEKNSELRKKSYYFILLYLYIY